MPGTSVKPELPALPEQSEQALRAVLNSQTFARAEKLQKFLRFVADMTFSGNAGAIHEHLIAIEVFARGKDYSPGEDSVVRRQAHALRRKLKDYYESEGKDDPVQIEIPVGSYVPVFREQQLVAIPDADEQGTRTLSPPEPGGRRPIPAWAFLLGSLVLGLGLFAAGWTIRGARANTAEQAPFPSAAVREIWEPWLGHSDATLFCFSNPPGTSVRQFSGPLHPNPEHRGLSVNPQQDAEFRRFFQFPDGGNLYLYPLSSQAKMGEALAAVSLATFFTRAKLPVRPTQSRFVTWESMRQQNVILFGHADSNQWIVPVLRSAPFTLAQTDQFHRARIVNLHPQAGELPEYSPTVLENNRGYALVSMLSGVDGSHEILVIGGLDTSSTAAAAEYLISPDRAAELLQRLNAAAPGHKGPWSFQVVLQTDVRDTVPLRAFPVALRVLP